MSAPRNIIKPDTDAIPVIISLGANLDSVQGDPTTTLASATERLHAMAAGRFVSSAFYRTAPVDCPPGTPDFINSAVIMTVAGGTLPRKLLAQLHQMEADFGRQREGVAEGKINAARCLDLDLIAFGDQRIAEPGLILPHPRAHERQFVLQPLAELEPDLLLPGQQLTVSKLLAQLPPAARLQCDRL